MDPSGFSSRSNPKPVENPSRKPGDDLVAGIVVATMIKNAVFLIIGLMFLKLAVFPWVLECLEIIYGKV